MFKLSNSSKQRRSGVDPRLIEISELAAIAPTFNITQH